MSAPNEESFAGLALGIVLLLGVAVMFWRGAG